MGLKDKSVEYRHEISRGSISVLDELVANRAFAGWKLLTTAVVSIDPYNSEVTMFYLWMRE